MSRFPLSLGKTGQGFLLPVSLPLSQRRPEARSLGHSRGARHRRNIRFPTIGGEREGFSVLAQLLNGDTSVNVCTKPGAGWSFWWLFWPPPEHKQPIRARC